MRGTTNVAAFRAYLDGERAFSVVDQDKMATSRNKFREATELDPKFARAWGYLSYSYVRSVLVDWLLPSELQTAENFARKAVELDALEAKSYENEDLDAIDYAPYWDLAFVYLSKGSIREAIEQYEKAIYLYNNFTDRLDRKPGLLAEAAVAYLLDGDRRKAKELAEKAKLIPGWYRWNLGFVYYMQENLAAAQGELEHPDLKPESPQFIPEMLLFLASAQARRGEQAKAEACIDMFVKLRPDFTLEKACERWTFTRQADNDYWREGLKKAGLGSPPV